MMSPSGENFSLPFRSIHRLVQYQPLDHEKRYPQAGFPTSLPPIRMGCISATGVKRPKNNPKGERYVMIITGCISLSDFSFKILSA
jgi:hypothetical protein